MILLFTILNFLVGGLIAWRLWQQARAAAEFRAHLLAGDVGLALDLIKRGVKIEWIDHDIDGDYLRVSQAGIVAEHKDPVTAMRMFQAAREARNA